MYRRKESDFMKKVLKYIGIIILIIVIIFAINTARKIIILSKLDKSVSNLEDTKDNICIKINVTS